MEKDHFKDRPKESTIYDAITIGQHVLICEKDMQRTAHTLEHLADGFVVNKLTRRDHPRGIKVTIETRDGEFLVGRVVYLINNGVIMRNPHKE